MNRFVDVLKRCKDEDVAVAFFSGGTCIAGRGKIIDLDIANDYVQLRTCGGQVSHVKISAITSIDEN